MKKTIKIIKDILKNKQICIDKEKLENNLLSLESMYKNNDLKTNFQDKAYSKAIDLIEKIIKIIKDILKNEQIQRCTTKLNEVLLSLESTYNAQKTIYQNDVDYVTKHFLDWTDECIQEMKVKSFTKKRKNKQSV